MILICKMCEQSFDAFGGLLFSPPVDYTGQVKKIHLCPNCYGIIEDLIYDYEKVPIHYMCSNPDCCADIDKGERCGHCGTDHVVDANKKVYEPPTDGEMIVARQKCLGRIVNKSFTKGRPFTLQHQREAKRCVYVHIYL